MEASKHPRQAARLQALASYNILDTEREIDFDEIAVLASRICETPIAVVNFIDADRQWFKAETGLGVRETPLETSICSHVILDEPFVEIPDTQADLRLNDNPLCMPSEGLRFYAGSQLITQEGLPLGTLCVLDNRPRSLSSEQREALKTLSRQVMKLLDLRRALAREAKARNDLRLIANQAPVMLMQVDRKEQLAFVNDAYADFLGGKSDEFIGRRLSDVVSPAVYAQIRPHMERALAGEPVRLDVEVESREGGKFTFDARYAPELNASDNIIGILAVFVDVTRERENTAHRDFLHAELAHRMRNSLTVIQSIANQTARKTASVEDFLETFGARLGAMQGAQDILLEGNFTGAKLSDLISKQVGPYATRGSDTLRINGPDIILNADLAHSLGLVLHEFATNAAKYGALSVAGGHVNLSWSSGHDDEDAPFLKVVWKENGGPPALTPEESGFGSVLIRSCIEQSLHGSLEHHYDPSGYSAVIVVPLP